VTVYSPFGRSKWERVFVRLKRLLNRIAGLASPLPNIFLVNLQNSGSSAIDPILREIVAKRWYFITPFGPEGSHLIDSIPHEPLYHWSHSSPAHFKSFLGRRDSKFIYLHRDLRDVTVSWAHDMHHRNLLPGKSLSELVELAYQGNLREPSHAAMEWLKQPCMTVRFDEMKADMTGTVRKICDYVGLYDVEDAEIRGLVDKYSFEKVTGRSRGEEGPMIRTGYMFRKGVSGEWKNHFDDKMKNEFKNIYGDALIQLGYERDLSW